MRVAVASKNIHEWLEELSAWPWPTHDTSAGFERPPAKRRKLFERSPSDNGLDNPEAEIHEKSYLGGLPASDVAAYEKRIHEIGQDMEDLDVEEIKNHILHNHILPLSRPGTPMSDTLRASTMSTSAYAHMDDFTALITATIVQALPNLSKLTRLLHSWSIRLLVLRKSSSFLTALMDAEIALSAGWKAMDRQRNGGAPAASESVVASSVLSRGEFDIMKLVVERKVAKAGQHLDYMLDALEGGEDTLPEDWIDRMDSVEQEYASWVAACERQIREAGWAKVGRETRAARASSPADVAEGATTAPGSPQEALTTVHDHSGETIPESETSSGHTLSSMDTLNGTLSAEEPRLAEGHSRGGDSDARSGEDILAASDAATVSSTPVIMVHPAVEDLAGVSGPEPGVSPTYQTASEVQSLEETLGSESDQLPDVPKDGVPQVDRLDDSGTPVDHAVCRPVSDGVVLKTLPDETDIAEADSAEQAADTGVSDAFVKLPPPHSLDHPLDDDDDFPDSEYPEPELPALPHERRASEVSNASTVIHGLRAGFSGFSSDPPDHGTPDHHRFRDVALPSTEGVDADIVDDADLPSSPPDFRSSTRSLSVSFNDIPTVVEAPEDDEDETPPDTPLDASFGVEDDLSRHDSPSKMSVASADDQLQQQISDILDSIPARIRLASEPSAINLNPPDFTMPASRPRANDSLPPRSYSSLSNRSSRAGTPSFTLAPAKNTRPRHQRGNQEIKLYHLSRSNGEPPIKLFIRCVGENGERVMVRVGGGWADLGEYLKEYASHHGRRGGEAKVEVRDLPRMSTASPPSRPASAMDVLSSPVTPLHVRKARRSIGSSAGEDLKVARQPLPKTPLANTATADADATTTTPPSGSSGRSRSSSRLSWTEEDSSLGMAGPKSKHIEMSDETKAWVESAKEKVRLASGDQRAAAAALALAGRSPAAPVPVPVPAPARAATPDAGGKFGELGKVGSTKRLFVRKNGAAPGNGNGSGTGK